MFVLGIPRVAKWYACVFLLLVLKNGHKAGHSTALRLHSSGALYEFGLLKAFLNESIERNPNFILRI